MILGGDPRQRHSGMTSIQEDTLKKSGFIKYFVLFLVLIFDFCILNFDLSFAADPASTNFSITESYFPAGRSDAQSSSYKIAEGGIDSFARAAASSTHYSVEGKAGISGTEKIPYITAISPGDLSRNYTDEAASFTVSASTPDGDALQYRVKQDGTTKAGPQSSNLLSWALGASDKGRHALSFEVIDPQGTVVKTQANYIYRRPVK